MDLYQAHAYDPLTPLEETLRTLGGFVRAGKIRYWELSNFTGWQLTKAVHLARAQKVAEDRGASMAEVAIAWVTARPGVSSTILGARTTSQLEANLRAARLRLSSAETAALDAASDPHPADYPYGELGVDQRARSLPTGH